MSNPRTFAESRANRLRYAKMVVVEAMSLAGVPRNLFSAPFPALTAEFESVTYRMERYPNVPTERLWVARMVDGYAYKEGDPLWVGDPRAQNPTAHSVRSDAAPDPAAASGASGDDPAPPPDMR